MALLFAMYDGNKVSIKIHADDAHNKNLWNDLFHFIPARA
jgi:hypothetical protein